MKKDKGSTRGVQLLALAVLGTLGTAPTLAQTRSDSYFYGGASVGHSRAKIDEERINASLSAAGLTPTGMEKDESDIAWKLFGGYQLNRYLGFEAGYFNLGRFGFTSTTTPAGTLNGQIKLQGLNLDLVGTLPITERFSAIGRVGAQYAQARDRFSGSGAVSVRDASPSKNETNVKLGIGVQYAFDNSVIVRAEGEHYRINDAVGNNGGINVFSLSLLFPFGRTAAPAPRPVATYVPPPSPAPAPVAAPVAAIVPAPAPLPATPPPERRRVSFSADSLFSFDESVVGLAGKAGLDSFAKDLQGTDFSTVTVEGHTDRLGSDNYNEKLLTRRAEAVKAYLVGSGRVDAAKISAVGKGETSPVTRPGDCKGNKRTAKLIACLQPDRRVEVEVTGTR